MTARQLAILTRTSPLAPSPLAQSKLRPPSTPMSQFSEQLRLVLCHPPGYAHKICGRYRAKSRRRSALVVSADVPSLPPGAWTTVGLKLVLFLPRPQSWRLCCKLLLFSSHWSEGHARTRGQISEETLLLNFFLPKMRKKMNIQQEKKKTKLINIICRIVSRRGLLHPNHHHQPTSLSATSGGLGPAGPNHHDWPSTQEIQFITSVTRAHYCDAPVPETPGPRPDSRPPSRRRAAPPDHHPSARSSPLRHHLPVSICGLWSWTCAVVRSSARR